MSEVNINEIISNPGAERIILSNCINDANILIECESEGLSPRHFAITGNKIIYSAIMYLFTKGASIDAMSIMNIIKDEQAKKVLDELGGLEYILLLQQSPRTYNINMFCQEIISCSVRRQVYEICNETQQDVIKTTEKDAEVVIGKINSRIMDLTLQNSKVQESYKMGDKLDERLKKYTANPTEVPGLSVGWKQFDKATGGAIDGDLIITVAEAKTGKSVTMLNWAKNIAIDQSLPILWIDSEQSDEEEELRLISNVSGVPESEIKTGYYTQDTASGLAVDKIASIEHAKELLKNSNFHHVSMTDFTLEKVAAVTRKFHLKYGIVAMFFDYIKLNASLISQSKGMRTDLILTTFTSGLKSLAGNLKIPVFTAAQENRSGYGSQEKDAKNIGESLGILQLATKLIFLRNLSDEEMVSSTKRANQELIIAYQRHGECMIKIPILYRKTILTQTEA